MGFWVDLHGKKFDHFRAFPPKKIIHMKSCRNYIQEFQNLYRQWNTLFKIQILAQLDEVFKVRSLSGALLWIVPCKYT